MKKAQGLVEYALILALVVFVVIAALRLTGTRISDVFLQTANSLGSKEEAPIEAMIGDFLDRIQKFYDENGRYPRSWGDYRFTDIGLDPADWADSVEGIFWNPNGSRVGLGNKSGDDIQVYVTDLDGNRLHLLSCLSAKWNFGSHVIVHNRSQNHEKKAQALQSGRKSSFAKRTPGKWHSRVADLRRKQVAAHRLLSLAAPVL